MFQLYIVRYIVSINFYKQKHLQMNENAEAVGGPIYNLGSTDQSHLSWLWLHAGKQCLECVESKRQSNGENIISKAQLGFLLAFENVFAFITRL